MASNELKGPDYDRVFRRDDFTCVYCGFDGHTFENWMQLLLDHVIPSAQGGESKDDNLVTCCFYCNALLSRMPI